MIDVKEILDKHGAYWVSKFDGKKSIDCENAKEAVKEIITEVLKEAANNAEINYLGGNSDINDFEINKESITSVINKTEITFEQFKKYVLKMEQKKIIGYKAPYDLFSGQIKKGEIFIKNNMHSYSTEKYKSMHVPKEIVETWEAVYEPEKPKEEIISMGSFDLKVTKEGIFHKSENITNYVKHISSITHNFNFGFTSKVFGYDLIVKDIVLSKTGCENSETTVSQWLKVWYKYQEFQK